MESGSPWESEALSNLRLQPTAQGAAAEPARWADRNGATAPQEGGHTQRACRSRTR